MKRSMKSKRVSWAPGVNLCQVALFRKEEFPSQVGLAREYLQIKTSCNSFPDCLQSPDLPPGFEGTFSMVARAPYIKWNCPPKFVMNPNWHVAAGEESEVGVQFLRESKELESVYPRSSLVLSSPSVSVEAYEELCDDSLTSVIPMIPIEEIKSFDPQSHLELPPFAPESHKISEPEPSALILPPEKFSPMGLAALASAGPNVAAAASAALTILLKSVEQGNMIDTNLLIKILSDPNMVGTLMPNSVGVSSMPKSNSTAPLPILDIVATKLDHLQAAAVPPSSSSRITVPVAVPTPTYCEIPAPRSAIPFPGDNQSTLKPVTTPIPAKVCSGEAVKQQPPVLVSSGEAVKQQPPVPVSSSGAVKQQPVKGIDYYKNLVRQHGGEALENIDQIYRNQNHRDNAISDHQKLKPGEKTVKHKHQQKRCMFYNSPKGCRNGSHCPFQHGSIPSNWQTGYFVEEPRAKRIRLGGEILGR